jgi:integrase
MATFRKRGERWQAIIRRHNLQQSRSFDRLTDAKAWARALEREADLGGTLPGQTAATLGAVIERYEREIWPQKRWGKSKANDLAQLARGLGKVPLGSLNKAALVGYMAALTVSPSTAGARMTYLRDVLRTARDLWSMPVSLDAVNQAIAVGRQQKILGRALVRSRRPTAAEIQQIIAAAERRENTVIDLAAIVRVLSVLPLRIGELCGIQWADIDRDRRTVVLRERKHPDRRVKENSVDVVPLIKFGGVDTFALIADRPGYLPSPYPYIANSVSAAFAKETLRLGIKNLHLHDLRAHAVSALLEAGAPIPQVALISGHRNWRVLQRNYSRLDPATVHDTLKHLS